MRLLAMSDLHLDAVTAGIPRATELDSFIDAVVERLRDTTQSEIDMVIVGGDYYDPGSLRESQHAARLFGYVEKIAEQCPSIWIAGNHDVVGDGSILSPLAIAARWMASPLSVPEIVERPRCVRLGIWETETGNVEALSVLALPFVSESPTVSMVECMKQAVEEARAAKTNGDHLVVVGHFTIPGIVPGSEEDMVRGRDLVFPAELIRSLEPDVVINGHFHRQQVVECGGCTIHIPGAPLRMTFGERDDGDRGWLEIEL